ncbi:hypothetical protein CMO86_08975 [Candidatus Woesearchaeota archaeon]|nr:hypothetical protein [Candidatus Woesearchaeota archaeon]
MNYYEKRKALCNACEHNTNGWKCNLCGCILTLKCGIPNQRCPMKPPKWVETTWDFGRTKT